jgi:hypothetical protein
MSCGYVKLDTASNFTNRVIIFSILFLAPISILHHSKAFNSNSTPDI